MGSLKKFNLVALWTTLGNCVKMQNSAAISETSIFFNILAIMHYIISKCMSTHNVLMVKKCCLMNMHCVGIRTAIIEKPHFFNICKIMHDNNIMKMVSTHYVSMVKDYHNVT